MSDLTARRREGNFGFDHGSPSLVVVPVYNHASTLDAVLRDLKAQGVPLLVVNDGSTDAIASVLLLHPEVDVVHHEVNRGKGAAIATGMRFAAEHGYKAILTFDADGQHLAKDVKPLIAAHENNRDALIIGARDFASAASGDVPGSSKFGRSFSNFWIWMESGRWLDDTQTGLRVYPVDLEWLASVRGRRYTFEVEAITRMIWQGRPSFCVPVGTFYPKRGERISHFDKFYDNYLLTRTHTRLVVLHAMKLLGLYRPVKLPQAKRSRPELKGARLTGLGIKILGRPLAYLIMLFPVLWALVSRPYERRALLQFYTHARPQWGLTKKLAAVFRNYLYFGASIVDRADPEGQRLVKSLGERTDSAAVAAAFPRGAILLGAHYGDWALIAYRVKPFLGGSLGLVLDPKVTPQFFSQLKDKMKGRLKVIPSGQDPLSFALNVKEVLDDQGNVAFLADRVMSPGLGTMPHIFLGETAEWPKAPFVLASRLGAPVVFVSAVKKGLGPKANYKIDFDTLWDGTGKLSETELLSRYVLCLEAKARSAPQHWFNFFPFW